VGSGGFLNGAIERFLRPRLSHLRRATAALHDGAAGDRPAAINRQVAVTHMPQKPRKHAL